MKFNKREIHVKKSGNDSAGGCLDHPYLTISKAAEVARPGDTIIVHEGEYREWVKPAWGGNSETSRITYKAADGESVVIKGSEVVTNWELVEGSVYKAVVDNSMFGDFNPFAEVIYGDWFLDPDPDDRYVHAGDLYVNGKSYYEAYSLSDLKNPTVREDGFNPPWTKKREPLLEPERSIYQWFAEVDETHTTIYGNFHEINPNEALVEINVRQCVFYPDTIGKNYITVKGFELCHAATTWAPPTGDQPGLIGPHWSKGWIIEDCIIHDAKCAGVSLGKEASTGDNLSTKTQRKPGYQYQMESVFRAIEFGWNKENIGSHIVRNNVIYDCGQNGIVGHMGCAFSEISGNHIYNISVKHEYYGYEIGGIKFHAPIDTVIKNNYFHNCTLGVWLDWQVQGTRITNNVFHDNDRDLFIEVTHGPHLVDNNILGSDYAYDNIAWGGAHVNNLVLGSMRRERVLDRATPYHFAHSTRPLSTTFVYGGDDRWFQNIFVGGKKTYTEQSKFGTDYYDGFPGSMEEYKTRLVAMGRDDHNRFQDALEPVYIKNNAYLAGAKAYDGEELKYISDMDPNVKIYKEDGKTYLEINIEEELLNLKGSILGTEDLNEPRIVEQAFENPDGSPITFDMDFHGNKRSDNSYNIGPFTNLKAGKNRILLWE